MSQVLIVEDEKDIAEAIEYNLKKEGLKVMKAFNGEKGLRLAQENHPHLIILDLMLPLLSGIEITKILKKDQKTTDIPIIMLTAKGEEIDRVLGLEMGAEDYIVKPFSMRELMVRVKKVLKRYNKREEPQGSIIKTDGLEIDPDKHSVKVNDQRINLTAKEFSLLSYLADNRGRVFRRDQLLDRIWEIEVNIETRTVDVHIRRLRKKLGFAGEKLKTIRGVGYSFQE